MSHTALLESPEAMPAKPRRSDKPARATAETMATRQRDIAVSEFFAKNRHLLGFDNPRKSLLTTVKEAVDNSLDACEEAGILPDITIVIEDLQPDRPASAKSSRYRVTCVDNGPGIVRAQVENVFGRLLFGSKFHRLKMSRGQQGIGISAAGMYGLITTGKPMLIQTRPKAHKPAHHIELAMNTKTNRAEVTVDEETDDFPLARLRELSRDVRDLADRGEFLSAAAYPTGTSVTIELEGKYQRGRGSVDEFLELTAIANPHARITLVRPTRTTEEDADDAPLLKGKAKSPGIKTASADDDAAPDPADSASQSPIQNPQSKIEITQDLGSIVVFPRAVSELPPETKEIQPHPRGVELGTLLQMLKDYEVSHRGESLYNFLQDQFCRVSANTAAAFCEQIGVTSRTRASSIESEQAEKLFKVFQNARLAPPPTDCLAPIGVRQLLAGMLKGVRAEFYAASSREAAVYRGRPFLIEAAIAFGGDLPADDSSRVIRFANRVPLLYQQSACSSFKAVAETNWRNYDLQQPRGGVPVGPLVIMIHMASVWVPFTSESKEAIADYDEIRKEMKLALMECGRKLGTYLRKRLKMRRESERRDIFERYIGEITQAINAINGVDVRKLYDTLLAQARKRTAIADVELDEEGKVKKSREEDAADEDGVIIVPSDGSTLPPARSARGELAGPKGEPVRGASKAEHTAAAMLKVASLRAGDDDDQPALIDTTEVKRLNQRGKPPRRPKNVASAKRANAARAEKPAPAKPAAQAAPRPTAPAKPAAKSGPSPAAAKPPAPTDKPKLRLVNGKLVPVDSGPGLF
ncbi:MAG: DNA topoisomerase VI subunit B [Phycisphaeraceae bacterium]|nr:DNA topoisomerase VI subunit B [Phycisphaeraceae bacterium]